LEHHFERLRIRCFLERLFLGDSLDLDHVEERLVEILHAIVAAGFDGGAQFFQSVLLDHLPHHRGVEHDFLRGGHLAIDGLDHALADDGAERGRKLAAHRVPLFRDEKVENAPERMRVETARYVGADNKGQKFSMTAQSAIQRTSEVPIVDIEGMFAQLALANGPLMIAANLGRYDLDTQKVAVNGPVRVLGPDGYRLETRDVTVDMKARQLTSSGPVAGQMRLGHFQAGHLHADLGERKVVLDGGARLKIVQGAVR